MKEEHLRGLESAANTPLTHPISPDTGGRDGSP